MIFRKQRKTIRNFYPRPPRGGRPEKAKRDAAREEISIHALREEGDSGVILSLPTFKSFLSTPSARRATAFMHRESST